MKTTFYIILPLVIASCSSEYADGVKNAKGETPVRYVICSQGEKSCFVAARFNDIDSCLSHKNWAEMLCDSKTSPEKLVCTKPSGDLSAFAYCTL